MNWLEVFQQNFRYTKHSISCIMYVFPIILSFSIVLNRQWAGSGLSCGLLILGLGVQVECFTSKSFVVGWLEKDTVSKKGTISSTYERVTVSGKRARLRVRCDFTGMAGFPDVVSLCEWGLKIWRGFDNYSLLPTPPPTHSGPSSLIPYLILSPMTFLIPPFHLIMFPTAYMQALELYNFFPCKNLPSILEYDHHPYLMIFDSFLYVIWTSEMNSLHEIVGKACILGRKRGKCMSRRVE